MTRMCGFTNIVRGTFHINASKHSELTGRGSIDSPETENELTVTMTARLNDVDRFDVH